MQIIVKDNEFTYTYDSGVNDKVDGGFVDEYYPSTEEVLEAAIKLLWNLYSPKEIAKTLKAGIPAMDYADD